MSDSSLSNLGAQAILAAKVSSPSTGKAIDSSQKLLDLANAANQPLFIVETVFPFDLFPDKLTIDRDKITINRHEFFFENRIQSVLVKDIMTVVVEQSLLLASLQIIDRMPVKHVTTVVSLPKSKAQTARWIIEGLIVSSQQQGLDLTKIPNDILVPKLIEIGRAKTL